MKKKILSSYPFRLEIVSNQDKGENLIWKEEEKMAKKGKNDSQSQLTLAHSCTRFPCYLGMEINTKTQCNEQQQRLSSWAIN